MTDSIEATTIPAVSTPSLRDVASRWFALGVAGVAAAAAAFFVVQLMAWPPHEDETLAVFIGRDSLGGVIHHVTHDRGGAPLHFLIAWAVVHARGRAVRPSSRVGRVRDRQPARDRGGRRPAGRPADRAPRHGARSGDVAVPLPGPVRPHVQPVPPHRDARGARAPPRARAGATPRLGALDARDAGHRRHPPLRRPRARGPRPVRRARAPPEAAGRDPGLRRSVRAGDPVLAHGRRPGGTIRCRCRRRRRAAGLAAVGRLVSLVGRRRPRRRLELGTPARARDCRARPVHHCGERPWRSRRRSSSPPSWRSSERISGARHPRRPAI